MAQVAQAIPEQRRVNGKGIPHRRWLLAILLGCGVLINYFDRVNLSVAKQALEKDFGIGNVGFGYLLSAYNWTYAALQLPTGVLLDRFGVQTIGHISALIWSLACFCGAFSPGVRTFFSSRLLLGIGEAPTFPQNSKATAHWFPSRSAASRRRSSIRRRNFPWLLAYRSSGCC